jgi:hypothetical protein
MRLGLVTTALALIFTVIPWSTIAAESRLPAPPAGYLQVDKGLCRFVVPEHNAGVTGELIPVCDESVPRIFSQLGVQLPDGERSSIEVRVVADPAQMAELAPEGRAPPSWSGAVAYPDLDLVLLSLRHRSGGPVADLDLVFEHELSHLALRKAVGAEARLPRWFSEGVAVQQSEESSVQRSGVLWWAAFGDKLLPLDNIERYPENPGAVSLAYAEAADFVGFLLRRGGWVELRVLMRRIALGEPFAEAFEFAYDSDYRLLEQRWREGLVGSSTWAALITGSGALWGLITALFVVAYMAVKKRRRKRLSEMEAEEAAVERLIDVMEQLQHKAGDPPKKKSLPERPPGSVKTKIRVDDEFHTLH